MHVVVALANEIDKKSPRDGGPAGSRTYSSSSRPPRKHLRSASAARRAHRAHLGGGNLGAHCHMRARLGFANCARGGRRAAAGQRAPSWSRSDEPNALANVADGRTQAARRRSLTVDARCGAAHRLAPPAAELGGVSLRLGVCSRVQAAPGDRRYPAKNPPLGVLFGSPVNKRSPPVWLT